MKGDVPAKWSRDKKIEALVPVAKSMVHKWGRRFAVHGMESDDVHGAAMVGVIYAVDHYDPSKGKQLKHFASLCANTRVMDECRYRYNLTKGTARQNEEYITWSPITYLSHDLDDPLTVEDRAEAGIDPFEDETVYDLHGDANANEAWENWRSGLTKLEQSVADLYLSADEITYEDVAKKLGVNFKCVDNSMYRVRNHMQEVFKKQGLDPNAMTRDEILAVRFTGKRKRA